MYINNEVASVEEGVGATIEINVEVEWTGSVAPLSPVPGYGWAPHEVGLYVSYFNIGTSLVDFKDGVNLVVDAANAGCFKLFVCKSTKCACHAGRRVTRLTFSMHTPLFFMTCRSTSIL